MQGSKVQCRAQRLRVGGQVLDEDLAPLEGFVLGRLYVQVATITLEKVPFLDARMNIFLST